MTVVETARIVRLLQDHPDWAPVLIEALAIEEQEHNEYWLGWENHDVHASRRALDDMMASRLLNVAYASRSSKYYRLADIEMIKSALNVYERGRLLPVESSEPVDPRSLFSFIVGHERVKDVLWRALDAQSPVHVLLVGPVATAKSLFLADLMRLPNSRYCLAGTATRIGLVDILLEEKPAYLLVDEIDHMVDRRDLDCLLELMESGHVTRVKHNYRESVQMRTWVFGAANETGRLREALLSRFWREELKSYTTEEFKAIVHRVLVERDGLEANLAHYIANRVGEQSRDVRRAVQVAGLASNRQDVDMLLAETKA